MKLEDIMLSEGQTVDDLTCGIQSKRTRKGMQGIKEGITSLLLTLDYRNQKDREGMKLRENKER